MKEIVLKNLKPRDEFVLWGKRWIVIEKISDGFVGDDGRISGGIIIRSLDNKEKIHVLADMVVESVINNTVENRNVLVKSDKILSEDEFLVELEKDNPHINKLGYVMIVVSISLVVLMIIFDYFLGH